MMSKMSNWLETSMLIATNFITYHLETPLGVLSEVLMRYHVHLYYKPWNLAEILWLEPIFFHLTTKINKCSYGSTRSF